MSSLVSLHTPPESDGVTRSSAATSLEHLLQVTETICVLHSEAWARDAVQLTDCAVRHTLPEVQWAIREPVTLFHSANVPGISLVALHDALRKGATRIASAIGLIALALFHRYAATTRVYVTAHMMHRLYVACVLVAAKAHCDSYPHNSRVARVSGVQLAELNRLETALLLAVEWRAIVQQPDIDALAADLAAWQRRLIGGSCQLHPTLANAVLDGAKPNPEEVNALETGLLKSLLFSPPTAVPHDDTMCHNLRITGERELREAMREAAFSASSDCAAFSHSTLSSDSLLLGPRAGILSTSSTYGIPPTHAGRSLCDLPPPHEAHDSSLAANVSASAVIPTVPDGECADPDL